MLSRVDFSPASRARVKLFANWGEAMVFWLSLGGLLFLAIVSGFRYATKQLVATDFRSLERSQRALVAEVRRLTSEKETIEEQLRVIHARLDTSQVHLAQAQSEFAKIKRSRERDLPPDKALPPGRRRSREPDPYGRSPETLKLFKIRKTP